MPPTHKLLNRMLTRGDIISVFGGRLCITPASGKEIPNDWMKENQLTLIQQCADQLGIDAYLYESYTTGHYGDRKHEGVTLTFTHLSSGASAFACFNANLKRQRNTKGSRKGKLLPEGQFSVPIKGAFYTFWLASGLKPPESATRFYDRMGRLSPIVFTAEVRKNERLDNQSIRPISITYEQLLSTHKQRITNAQLKHKERITTTHKEIEPDQEQQGIEPTLGTGENRYSNTVIQEHRYKGGDKRGNNTDNSNESNTPQKAPISQTHDEWLAEYNEGNQMY